jgi:hypothetical protein
MKSITMRAALLAAVAGSAPLPAAAQYCANYTDGTKSCGIPTLQSCEQSLSGVGGYCGPDQSAQIPDNLMQRWRQERDSSGQRFLHPPRPSEDQPGGLNWMPPPPGQ